MKPKRSGGKGGEGGGGGGRESNAHLCTRLYRSFNNQRVAVVYSNSFCDCAIDQKEEAKSRMRKRVNREKDVYAFF